MNYLEKILQRSDAEIVELGFRIEITIDFIKVEHFIYPDTEILYWDNLLEIRLVNTDKGPFLPDVWLVLIDNEHNACFVPQDLPAFQTIYDIVSKFPNFNHQNVIQSMTSTHNAEYHLWSLPHANG